MKTIKLENGIYSAEILDQGATLYSFAIDGHDIVLGFEDKNDHIASDSYLGQIVGPYANRIADASYQDEYGIHKLEVNNGKHHLHSGSRNYGFQEWSVKNEGKSFVELELDSPEAFGYPGNQKATVKYTLSEDGRLRIEYKIQGDKMCPVNPTNHAFFNLNGSGDIRNTVVTIPGQAYLEVDEGLIPTNVTPVDGTDFDFRTPHAIGERRNGSYDNCFTLDEGSVVRAENDNYALEVTTSLPSVQLYTGVMLHRKEKGKKGMNLFEYTGFCLETEYYPDFPNRPDFKGSWIKDENPYESWTEFHLFKK